MGRTDWESQGSKFQQNAHICPYIKQNLTSSGTPLTISSNSLLANCRFKQHHILSLMPGTKIPHELKDGGIFRASALSRLHTCAVQKRCFSYQPPPHTHTLPLCPIPIHGRGIISYNLSFFVVEVDLYLAALMKSFDVLLRYTASFLAFCLPCLL